MRLWQSTVNYVATEMVQSYGDMYVFIEGNNMTVHSVSQLRPAGL